MTIIGVSYNSLNQLFSGEAEHTAFLLYNILYRFYDVILINNSIESKDNLTIDSAINGVAIKKNIMDVHELDILIDIDGIIHPDTRNRVAKRSIVFLRTFLQFSELEKSVYDLDSVPRNFNGVSEIWCWDILNSPETLQALQSFFKCPIRALPFYYTPYTIKQPEYSSTPYNINILEFNPFNCESNIYSNVLLLTSLAEINRQTPNKYSSFIVQMHSNTRDNNFMKQNVLNNIKYNELGIIFTDPSSVYSLSGINDIVLSHTRFASINIGLLDLIFLGVPFIHNSPTLKNIHPILERLFYSNNSISELCIALDWFNSNSKEWYDNIEEIRKSVMEVWTNSENLGVWKNRINELLNQAQTLFPKFPDFSQTPKIQEKKTESENIIIAFSDFWPGFNYNSNFITDSVRNELLKFNNSINILGIEYYKDCNPNIVVFGPYGNSWKNIPKNIPKVFFTAENWGIPDTNIDLLLTPYKNNNSPNHIRLPTWMTFIDWFNTSTELPTNLNDNPIRFPVHFIRNINPIPFDKRQEFCGFVVSNPVCKLRNETFLAVNEYKKVNSGGALFNNIGGQLSLKYPGGGCGDISKYHFLTQHKFQLCFENSQASGYITEKVMHSKIAGCVPIYWGDSDTDTDFTPNSFINLSHLSDPHEIRSIFREVENNPELCNTITNTPLLNDEKYQNALNIISNISQRILNICGVKLLNKIDKVFVINLDRRSDRWDNWCKDNPLLSNIASRFSAVDGKNIQLTQNIYNVFKFNSFNWKRAMVGCTLSHMSIWLQLLAEPDSINSYLVLEDDMRFNCNNWLSIWNELSKEIPEDAEILYIGGVLPTNKKALPSVLDPVNNHWAKIKPNTLFGTSTPQPIFHFCAYSYILTKRGAKKLLDWLAYSKEKCFCCNDHLMGHPIVGLNKYVSIQQITKCFQEDDINYLNSDFNTVDRADTFDSDIWNSIDNFNNDELAPFTTGDESIKHIWLPIWDTLKNMNVSSTTKSLLWPRNFIKSLNNSYDKNIIINYYENSNVGENTIKQMAIEQKAIEQKVITNKINIYYFKEYCTSSKPFILYEKEWIKTILGDFDLKQFNPKDMPPKDSWFIVMRPFSDELNKLFNYMHSVNYTFKILHLSDEFAKDNIEFYKLSSCKQVVRNYIRSDIPTDLSNILTIPLGFHHKSILNIKSFNEREYIWSFHGTNWFNRKTIIDQLTNFKPYSLHFTPDWNHTTMTNQYDYIDILTNSKFCPILRGNNIETFRLYECLENGVIPIYVRMDGDDEFWNWITSKIKLINLKDWSTAKNAINYFISNPDKAELYRTGIITQWNQWKNEIKIAITS